MARSKISFPKKKTNNKLKSIGLFDHVKHIREVRDPKYFDNLSDVDKKSFDHFMILKTLSMDPRCLDVVSLLYQFFDTIPSSQFYKLLISLLPSNSTYYPWIKSQKNKYKEELVNMISRRYEISYNHAEEYISLLLLTDEGIKSLIYICQEFGKSEKEIEELLFRNDG